MLSKSTVALALLSVVVANSFKGIQIDATINWGCSNDLKNKAPQSAKDQCSTPGSFFTEYQNQALCASNATRTQPEEGLTCPLGWDMHITAKCCIPPAESYTCDCGEGYSWNGNENKCITNSKPHCGKSGQWWHERSNTCARDSWDPSSQQALKRSPPAGSPPSGKTCPTDWFWHAGYQNCKPHSKRSPQPDCEDWSDSEQSCGFSLDGPKPTCKHHCDDKRDVNRNGIRPGWKRDINARQQNPNFPQSKLDAMYCPNGLHACSVFTPRGGEWSYECIDFATELESCGGCASSGEGMDCTAISHALSVGCEAGICAVHTCEIGFSANGTVCVPT